MRAERRLTWFCTAIAGAALASAVALAVISPLPSLLPLLVFGALVAFAENRSVVVRGNTSLSASFMLTMAAIVVFHDEGALLGPLLIGMCGGFYLPHLRQREWRKVAFNLGNFGLASLAGAGVFWLLTPSGTVSEVRLVLCSVPAALAYSLVDLVLLSRVVSMAADRPIRGVFRELRAGHLQIYPFALLGVFLGYLYLEVGAAILPLFVVPILVARQTFASYLELKAAHEATLYALIVALEAKDRYTAGHVERVAQYAEYIGLELGLRPARLERLRFAALMHDVGKLVVANDLLNKPGRLTRAEYDKVRQHEAVSMDILRRIDFLAPMAPSASSELGHFDGAMNRGAPIEPQIIAVADAYDAMTSTRSYRRALDQEVAFRELRSGAGTQFHPRYVEALITAIERRGEEHGAGHESADVRWTVPPPSSGAGSAGLGDFAPDPPARVVR
jgi:HD domain-containing protein